MRAERGSGCRRGARALLRRAGGGGALRSGAAPILLGALPFDVNAPAALMVPGTVRRTRALPPNEM